jgi:hypothetical protein
VMQFNCAVILIPCYSMSFILIKDYIFGIPPLIITFYLCSFLVAFLK